MKAPAPPTGLNFKTPTSHSAAWTHEFKSAPGLHPLERMGEVREIVESVLYLESAAFVTGEPCTSTAGRMRGIGNA